MEQKPAVFVFTTSYRPFVGGAELAVENIARRLKNDFDFYILTARVRRDLPPCENAEEGTIIRLGLGVKFDKYFLPFLIVWKLIFVSDFACLPDRQGFRASNLKNRRAIFASPKQHTVLFWGVMVSYASIGAWILKWLRPEIPFILTIQEGDEEWKFKWKTLGMSHFWWHRIFSKADFLTAISRYLLDVVRRHGYKGPAEVVPNGVDEKLLGIERKPVDLSAQAGSGKVIFSASRLVPKNGLDILLLACGKLKNDFNFRVVLAGDGPERGKLERMAKALHMEDRVKFLGSVPYDNLSALYREADIFARPSRREGLGSAFLEAMAAGVITIGAKVGGTSDFLYEGITGFAVRPEDPAGLAEAIRVALLLTPKRREEIITAARAMIRERFLWDKIAGDMKRIFNSQL